MSERNYTTSFDPESGVFTKKFRDGTVLSVNVEELPDISKQYCLMYGLTQSLNDSHAGEKDLNEIIRISNLKAEALMNGIIARRAGEGLGLGVNLDLLTQAVANTQYSGDLNKAKEMLAKFIPEDDDDEDVIKAKKARLRKIRNFGEIKMEIDKLSGNKFEDLLA